MIKVNGLEKSFDGNLILKGVDIEINKGDVIAIIGPSGSGKTTLLRCLNFLEKADKGVLYFDDEKIDLSKVDKNTIKKIRNKTAFVFQGFNLFQNKTALENVTLGLIVSRKMNKDKANEIGKQLLDKVGLTDKYDSYPSQLSGGQQQRVAIARALAQDPEIIYFDEPTSALDPELIAEVLGVIKDLANEGMTMLVVTHELNFAKNISNEVIFMEEGKVIQRSDSKTFFEKQNNERISSFINSLLTKRE